MFIDYNSQNRNTT